MSAFKSGVVHDDIAITDKETAQAMMDTLKANSGLFKADLEGGYVAPHFCTLKPTGEIMMVKNAAGKPVRVRSYTVESKKLDGKGSQIIRHFMAKCTDINCNRVKLEGVKI